METEKPGSQTAVWPPEPYPNGIRTLSWWCWKQLEAAAIEIERLRSELDAAKTDIAMLIQKEVESLNEH